MCSLLPSSGSKQIVHSSLKTCGGTDGPGSKSMCASRMEMLGTMSIESCVDSTSAPSGGNIAAEKKPPLHRTGPAAGESSMRARAPDNSRQPTSLLRVYFRRGTWKSLQHNVSTHAAQYVSVSVKKNAHPIQTTGCPPKRPHSPRSHLVDTRSQFHIFEASRRMRRLVSPNPSASIQSRSEPCPGWDWFPHLPAAPAAEDRI